MKVHLTAIGGTGMAAIAGLLHQAGHEVRGSDGPIYPPMSTLLQHLGIPVREGYAPHNLDWGPDLLVLGNACKCDHVEYLEARRRELPVVSFPQLLAQQFLPERTPIVVAGTHGKTTTTSIIAHLLRHAGLDPGFFIGGVPANLGQGFALGKPPYFVLEGDEYDTACFDKRPKFLHYRPQVLVLTGVEFDHADIYADLDAVAAAFAELIALMPADGHILVADHSALAVKLCSQAACRVQTYAALPADRVTDEVTNEVTDDGTGDGAALERCSSARSDWTATFAPLQGGRKQQLEITHRGQPLGQIEVPLCGAHNMANALAAVAVAHSLGVRIQTIAEGLGCFAGVARRQQVRGIAAGVTVIDDFAHHPTAVRETLRALHGVHGSGALIAVFEPRSSTSRRNVFRHELPAALGEADRVLVAPLFQPHKVPEPQRLDLAGVVADLEAMGKPARVLDVDAIVAHLVETARPQDTVVVMSSGGFGGLIDKLLAALQRRAHA